MENNFPPKNPLKVNPNFQDIYLAKDDAGNPTYGFTVQGHTVIQFHTYPAFGHASVELPRLDLRNDPWAISHTDMLAAQAEQTGTFTAVGQPLPFVNPARDAMSSDQWLQNYADGGLTIARGCFAGYDHLRINVPNNYSVKLEPGCFDPDASIELVLPAELGLKRVAYAHATPHGRSSEQWLLVAHRDFNYQGTMHATADFAAYTTSNYQRQKHETHLTVKHLPKTKLSTCTIADQGCSYLSHLAKAADTALRPYQPLAEVADAHNPFTTQQIFVANPDREQ